MSTTRTETAAPQAPTGDLEDSHQKFLTFALGEESYGIDIRDVIEIIGIQKITPVPGVPEAIRGVINLRGKVVPVMDVRLRFGLPAQAYHDRTCIIVIDVGGNAVGLVVDTVAEVADIRKDQIETPPDLTPGAHSEVMRGLGKIGDDVKILLNVEPLVLQSGLRPQALPGLTPSGQPAATD